MGDLPIQIRAFDPKRDMEAFMALNSRTFWDSIPDDEPILENQFRRNYEWLMHNYAPHDPDKAIITVAAVPGLSYAGHCWLGVQREFFTASPLAWIFDITIHPNYRGRGIGRRLLHDMLHRAKSKGFDQIGLQVMHHNREAMEFYQREGFIARSTTLTRRL